MNYKKCTLQDVEYGEKTEKRGKLEMHTEGLVLWLETLKNVQNEKHTLQDLEYGVKTDQQGK